MIDHKCVNTHYTPIAAFLVSKGNTLWTTSIGFHKTLLVLIVPCYHDKSR